MLNTINMDFIHLVLSYSILIFLDTIKKVEKKLRNNLFLNALLGIQLQQTACVGIFRLPTFISNVCCLIFS